MYDHSKYITSIEIDEMQKRYYEANPIEAEHIELYKLKEEGCEFQIDENAIKAIDENGEIINEDVVYEDRSTISIHVDPTPNTNFKYDPYIKVYNGPYSTATKVVRIYLKDAGLDYSHKDRFGKLSMTMSLARQLNDIMNMRFEATYTDKNGKRKTRKISIYGYLWTIIQHYCPDAEYIPKPDFTKYRTRKE